MANKRIDPSERPVGGMIAAELGSNEMKGYTEEDRRDMWRMGKKQELRQAFIAQMAHSFRMADQLPDAIFDSSQRWAMQLACEYSFSTWQVCE